MLAPLPPEEVRAAAASLEYRALVVLGMVTRKADMLGCSYVYQLNRPYNRVFDMTAFSPRACPPGRSLIAVEIPCLQGGFAWGATAEKLFDTCIGSLAEDGILGPGDVERLHLVRAAHAYPIYRLGWSGHLRRVLEHVASLGFLTTLGRSGEFRYMDIDRCLRRAFDRADEILGETGR
jgi:protoporphyrinogen oxidase